MDKVTRVLLMFSRLTRGERINKASFCLETDINARSFDRDIEDIRLYLSEFFQMEEVIYDHRDNSYYLSGIRKRDIEMAEYYLLERILTDSHLLRSDEIDGLLSHIAINSENASKALKQKQKSISEYYAPYHNKAVLKIHGDLTTVINSKSVITLKYTKSNGEFVNYRVLPCELRFDMGYIYLIAYKIDDDNEYPAYFRLDRINSFSINGLQNIREQNLVEKYKATYSQGVVQMFGGEYIEITLMCDNNFYPQVKDKFKNAEIIENTESAVCVKLSAFDGGFTKWLLSQSSELVTILEPQSLKSKIAAEAEMIFKKYMEVLK